jgi:hypothetical protein
VGLSGGALPAVSVVIPFLDRAASLVRAVDSALAQQGVAVRVIAVDDGSTDGGGAALTARGDPRITLIRHPRNLGAAAARNSGIAAAGDGLVALLDSDDEFLPGKLAAQVRLLDSDRLDVVFGGFLLQRGARAVPVVLPDLDQAGWQASFLDGCFVSPGSTLLARGTALAAIGPYDAALRRFEDWDLLLRAAIAGVRFGAVAQPVALVAPARHPPPSAVEPALAALTARHAAAITAWRGRAARRRFLASLAIERAVARARAGDPAGAAAALPAALVSPARVGAFLGRQIMLRIPAFRRGSPPRTPSE